MSHNVKTYVLEHGDNPEMGDYLRILPCIPDLTQSYYRKTHTEVSFPVFPSQFCVYHLAMSHYGEAPGLKQLGVFKTLDEAILFAKQQYRLTMGSYPLYRTKNPKTRRQEWREVEVIMNPDMKSELILAENCHNDLVIISANHFEGHSLTRSTLWEPSVEIAYQHVIPLPPSVPSRRRRAPHPGQVVDPALTC